MRAELEAKEYRRGPALGGEAWESWVPKFLERHCESPRTRDRYEDAWKWGHLWLSREKLHSPRSITYRRALEYIEWRINDKKTGSTVGRNTTILELKVFAMIMGEAVRLGHTDANPLLQLKLKRDKAAKKPEMTDAEIVALRSALLFEP